jgi:hypothetical protein
MDKEKLRKELHEKVNAWFEEKPQRPIAQFMLDTMLPYIEGSAVEMLREARHYAMRVRMIAKVHVTIDFYLRLQADKDYGSIAPIYDVNMIGKEGPMPLFGRPCEVHFEPCDKEFWFEGEDGKEIIVP